MFIKIQKSIVELENFTIFGERHSGTNFLERLFTGKDSWENTSKNKAFHLPITWQYGWKHFFGFHDDLLIEPNSNKTLFLGIIRNPYDWLMAMYKMPHHLRPERGPGWNRYDNINDFLTCPNLVSKYHDPAIDKPNIDNNPYSLNGYKNIFELRQVKLHYLLYLLPSLVQNYCLISYEHLTLDTQGFIKKISEYYQLPIDSLIINDHKLKHYTIDSATKEIIDSNLDWSMEEICGYTSSFNLTN